MRRLTVVVSVFIVLAGLFTNGGLIPGTAAQDLTKHPIVGAWLIMNPSDPPSASPAIFAADGTLTVAYVPTSYLQPERGVVLQGAAIGVWEPTGERSIHLTYVQALSDLQGTYLGTFTLDAYPEVSEDGRSFLDDGTQVHFTFRDATNTIVQEVGGESGAQAATPPVHAMRMQVGNPGFPDGTAITGTPTG
jgi:hypothetical protein